MRKRKSGGHETAGSGAERWLLTYADMITLLLALFIVLFSMSTIDVIKFDAFKHALSNEFHGQVIEAPGAVIQGDKSPLNPEQHQFVTTKPSIVSPFDQSQPEAKDLQKVKADVKDILKKDGLALNKLGVKTTERGVVISLAGDAFFQSGSAELNPKMLKVVIKVAATLRNEHREISVEGHTDGQPISTAEFPSNWELSSARSMAILKFLISHGVRQNHISQRGFADTRYAKEPAFPHQSVAANRRVEIVILVPGANIKEAQAANLTQAQANGSAPARPLGSSPPTVVDLVSIFSTSG